MINIHRQINVNYGWELVLFHKVRNFSDGITFLESKINWDKYLGDHTPAFNVYLEILNFTILEFNIYYLYHRS